MRNVCVFASGTGSNFEAIYNQISEGKLDCNIALLVSDRKNSKAVEKARKYGIDVFAFSAKDYPSKEIFELEIKSRLEEKEVELIILAGYMRLIGDVLLKSYPRRILNIHPSILPAFKGKDAVGQAMAANADVTGVTVHYVDEGMDTGEIIMCESLDISNMNTREEIETNIHKIEHKLYPKVIKKILEEMK